MLSVFLLKLAHYSASWVLSSLTQTLERQFLFLAEGEGAEELNKTEDSEPMPATPDPWARGSVHVVEAPPSLEPALQQVLLIILFSKSSVHISAKRLCASMSTVYLCLYNCF